MRSGEYIGGFYMHNKIILGHPNTKAFYYESTPEWNYLLDMHMLLYLLQAGGEVGWSGASASEVVVGSVSVVSSIVLSIRIIFIFILSLAERVK